MISIQGLTIFTERTLHGEYSNDIVYTIDLRKLIQFQLDDTESRWNDGCWEVNVADEDDIVVDNLVSLKW